MALNLRGIANNAIQGINPNLPITLRMGSYQINPDTLLQEPVYTESQVMGNVQSLSNDDLAQVAAVNLEGTVKAVYLYGNVSGVVRSSGQASSELLFKDDIGGVVGIWTWNVYKVAEAWPGWCKVFAVLQENEAVK